MKYIHLFAFLLLFATFSKAQNVGIGTNTPNTNALLHVETGTSMTAGTLITGTYNFNSLVPNLGAGSRLMFFPGKVAFRAGRVDGVQWDNVNTGLYSFAGGFNTIARGSGSFAMGISSIASGTNSVALGNSATASGTNSVALGNGNVAGGFASLSTGFLTSAHGNLATAMGDGTRASGTASSAFGTFSVAKANSLTVVGNYNDSMLLTEETFPVGTSPLFIVGNGTDHNNRSNALVVRRDGNTGMGTNVPAGKLHIKTNTNFAYPHLMLEETDNDFARLTFINNATSFFWTIAASPQATNAASTMNFFFNNYGDVLSLKGNGNAILTGTLTQTSDARLKENVVLIPNALEKITQLNGYNYYWKNKLKDQSLQTGLLAQEVQRVIPELVTEDEKGNLAVNYSGLIPVLIESIKEQQTELSVKHKLIENLQKELNIQQQQINELTSRMEKIENRK